MATKIQWTEETWNPIVGCSVVTPGCTNCYAMRMGWRLANNPATPHYAGTVEKVNGKPVWTGKIARAPERVLTEPLRRKKPTMYFVNSMGDLFHEDIPDEQIDRVFAVMALAPQHTFQVLTKRGDRQREYVLGLSQRDRDGICGPSTPCEVLNRTAFKIGAIQPGQFLSLSAWPLSNVWLGVSIEDRKRAEERAWHLANTPAAVRFWSVEPLLEDLGRLMMFGLYDTVDEAGKRPAVDWVIVGGESGPNARPMDPDWARSIRDQCRSGDVAFFMKQMSCKAPIPSDLQIRQFPEPRP